MKRVGHCGFLSAARSAGFERVCSSSLAVIVKPSSLQCRAARVFLGWNQKELAEKAGVGIVTVNQFETGISEPRRATLEVIRLASERAGLRFIDENGGGIGLRLQEEPGSGLDRHGPKQLS